MGRITKALVGLGAIVTILVGIWAIMGFSPIMEWNFDKVRGSPFEITVSPNFIEEGIYKEGVLLTFAIIPNEDMNITSLQLLEKNVIINRLDKTEQTQVATINWKNTKNGDYIIYENIEPSRYIQKIQTKEITGLLYGCENCFMGKTHTYEFTFTLQYKENEGALITKIIKISIPIK